VVAKDFLITKKLDKATPKLMELCAKGQVVPELELDVVADNDRGRVFYKVTLKNVMITSITTNSICEPDCKMVDEIALRYSSITWTHWDNRGGKTEATYNFQTQR
jgi:type VI secretion system secreted protein Hcp